MVWMEEIFSAQVPGAFNFSSLSEEESMELNRISAPCEKKEVPMSSGPHVSTGFGPSRINAGPCP